MARKKYIKNSRLETTLTNYGNDMKALTNIKPQQFDINTVGTMIISTPNRKWNAAQAIVNATVAKKNAELNLKKIKAIKMLNASNTDLKVKLSNADDRKAYVDNDADVQAAEIELINAEAEFTAAKLGYDCLDDLFTAGKKIMDWLNEQERATQQYNRYIKEGEQRS